MKYNSLYKAYVQMSLNDFEKEYQNRLNSSSSLLFDLTINDYPMFFTYNKDIMEKVALIDEENRKIKQLINKLPLQALNKFISSSMIEEIDLTNKIEGVVSSKQDIQDLINEIKKLLKTNNRFLGIVSKYLNIDKEIKLDNANDLRILYDEMLYEEIKEEDSNNMLDGLIFRKESVDVLNQGKVIHHGLMDEERIIEYVNKSLKILNNPQINLLIRLSVFHYLLGYIHPFYDGNGRINRFITSYYLNQYYNRLAGYNLSSIIFHHESNYLKAFKECNDIRNRGDVTTFVYYFIDIIYLSFKDTFNKLSDKIEEVNHYMNLINDLDYSSLEKEFLNLLIQNNLFNDLGITKTEIEESLNRKTTTITKVLSKFKKDGIMIELRSGRYIYYKLNLEKLINSKD